MKKQYFFYFPFFAKMKNKFIKWNLTRESELILDQFKKK